jgi:hypothetical protein
MTILLGFMGINTASLELAGERKFNGVLKYFVIP